MQSWYQWKEKLFSVSPGMKESVRQYVPMVQKEIGQASDKG